MGNSKSENYSNAFKDDKTMNILFLSLSFSTEGHRSFYEDLLEEFQQRGDHIYVCCANEKKSSEKAGLTVREDGVTLLRVPTGNITGNVPLLEKGISTIMIDRQFLAAIYKYFKGVLFDLILYPTPPITLVNTIAAVKNKTKARTYLLLKDIFPQNAVDLNMMSKTGFRGLVYKYFRRKEKRLYQISDIIGCMSPANVDYVLRHNSFVKKEQVEVCPNCIKRPLAPSFENKDDSIIRERYGIPQEAVTFIYGGNLGKPQGIPFLMRCLEAEKSNAKVFFIIVGSGSEYDRLKNFLSSYGGKNALLLDYLPKDEYKELAGLCQVGMIFLDYRFTIPNYPSRLLSYITSGLPILCATDPNTDIGTIAEENGYGVHCLSNDVKGFSKAVQKLLDANREEMGRKGWEFFVKNYTTATAWHTIANHFKNK